jgi:deoxyribodipyrimidine photo-lyase
LKTNVNVFWFRRDLRIEDNVGLLQAMTGNFPVIPVFIFDKNILDKLEKPKDARVEFIFNNVQYLKREFQKAGSDLRIFYSTPEEAYKKLLKEFDIKEVYTNEDYEPYARSRDERIKDLLKQQGISFHQFKDVVIFHKDEVLKDDGLPYTVFTPYMKKWKKRFTKNDLKPHKSELYLENAHSFQDTETITLKDMGFSPSSIDIPSHEVDTQVIQNYHETRDIPSLKGTTRMSVHLRFGTVSIRSLALKALINEKYLNELIWRDFYIGNIMYHFPNSATQSFKKKYDRIPWRNDEEGFNAWCKGKTGYPIVDAGMRELNATGFMHNRVRMIVASFLCKHLLIDWRLGAGKKTKQIKWNHHCCRRR